jgi:hypothetical protein
MKRIVYAAAVVLIVLSGGRASAAPQSGGPSCPLAPLHRQLVEEIVAEVFNDAVWVAANEHDVDRGFALSLVGTDSAYLGAVTRIGACEKARTFVPFCERDGDLPLVRCSRLACEAAGVDTVEVSISGGKPKYNKRTTLEYAATTLSAVVVYDPFPSVVWRTVEVEPGTYSVSANLFRRPVVTPAGGAPVDLTHAGAVSVKIVAGEITSVELDLAFPMLVPGEAQLVADISFDAQGVGTGAIRRGGETLATVSGDGDVLITWSGACAG